VIACANPDVPIPLPDEIQHSIFESGVTTRCASDCSILRWPGTARRVPRGSSPDECATVEAQIEEIDAIIREV
jgi:hypothetical protein